MEINFIAGKEYRIEIQNTTKWVWTQDENGYWTLLDAKAARRMIKVLNTKRYKLK